MFGNHGLCGLLEEGAHGKSPKCLGGNLGDFGEFCKGLRSSENPSQSGFQTTFVVIFGDVFSTEQSVHIRRFFAVRQADVDAENAVELAALDFGIVVVHQRQAFFEVVQCH